MSAVTIEHLRNDKVERTKKQGERLDLSSAIQGAKKERWGELFGV